MLGTLCWGSSPRLRGTLGVAVTLRALEGIIPALAGNTFRTRSTSWAPRDHPRACGEHFLIVPLWWSFPGSSPRLRGTHHEPRGRQRGRGIIPALAGNTTRARGPRRCARDHPRACGEHCRRQPAGGDLLGSSPRLRGTLDPRRPDIKHRGIIPRLRGTQYSIGSSQIETGIIPALAGNTLIKF